MNNDLNFKSVVKTFLAVALAALVALAAEVVVFNWQALKTASLSGIHSVSEEAYDSNGYHCIEYTFDGADLESIRLTSDLPDSFDSYSSCSVFVIDEGSSVYTKLGDMWLGADSSYAIYPTGKVQKLLVVAAPVTPKVGATAGTSAANSSRGGGSCQVLTTLAA